ncbi:hypothetical protein GP486_003760 [Trichoglossum hirsutum]|uniref:Mitochondrial carrier protein n=1 Tax=Trichoglossum hirsutum TaxID=265104 RepID=A0A9P8RQ83_9PEZI|nr:hypothetical protein GP486_003760 [Trichoglossum hirsutum]
MSDFWAGYVSGATGIIIGNPFDLIKVRLQAGTPISISNPASFSSQFDSLSSLIKGATAPILGYGALNALLFVCYNRTLKLLDDDPRNPSNLWKVWSAGAAGGLATFVVSAPTELVKCRAQVSPSDGTTSLSITRDIIRTNGVRGLFFGGTVTSMRDSIGYGF